MHRRAWISLSLILLPLPAFAGWEYARGNRDAANHSGGVGELAANGPAIGIAGLLEPLDRELGDVWMRDVTNDGVAELVFLYRGRPAALDPVEDEFAWIAPVNADAIVGFGDYSGDGVETLLVTSNDVGGGVFEIGLDGGGLVGERKFSERSGIDEAELSVANLDADPEMEYVTAAGVFGLARLWAMDGLSGDGYAELGFDGYSNLTPTRVGSYRSEDGHGVVLDQGATQTLFDVCEPADEGASCDGDLCLCPSAVFFGVHSTFAFGEAFVVDADGDGIDEVLTVASHPSYTRSVSLFRPADGLPDADTEAATVWYRDYPGAPTTRLWAPFPPAAFAGDGLQVVVNFVNNGSQDTDRQGMPLDDGLDEGGAAFAVFDAQTGEVAAFSEGQHVFGRTDLDGDGTMEFIVVDYAGDAMTPGLRGLELNCDSGCVLEEAWSDASASVFANPSDQDADSAGRATVPSADFDNDGNPEIIVYQGESFIRLGVGGVEVEVEREPNEQILAFSEEVGHLVTATSASFVTRDGALEMVHPIRDLPAQGAGEWRAFPLSSDAEGDAVVFAGQLYPTPTLPDFGPGQTLLPHWGLAADLDGDDKVEFVTFRVPTDDLGPGFAIRAQGYDDGLETLWELDSEEVAELDDLSIGNELHFSSGDVHPNPGIEVIVGAAEAPLARVIVVGADGTLLDILEPSVPVATNSPFLIDDVVTAEGNWGTDGLEDIIVAGSTQTEVHTLGFDGAVATAPTGFYHGVGANVDVDGDGKRDLVSTLSVTLDNKAEVFELDGGIEVAWGPAPLGRPTGRVQVLTVLEIDEELVLAYGTGDGTVELISASTGTPLQSSPIALGAGGVLGEADPASPPVSALASADVDGDGLDELIVGDPEGWVYALNPEVSPATAEWAEEVGSGVRQLGLGDPDSDGLIEVLVATQAGQGIVLDANGADVDITSPGQDECISENPTTVSGAAEQTESVLVYLNGQQQGDPVPVEGGTFEAEVTFGGPGFYEIEVRGYTAGELVALTSIQVQFGGDEDGDGWTTCGNDCDDSDPDRNPGAEELCEDGVDQDCDGVDDPCEAGEDAGGDGGGGDEGDGGSSGAEAGAGEEDGGNGCNCSTDSGGSPPIGGLVLAMLGLGLGRRRQRTDTSSRGSVG